MSRWYRDRTGELVEFEGEGRPRATSTATKPRAPIFEISALWVDAKGASVIERKYASDRTEAQRHVAELRAAHEHESKFVLDVEVIDERGHRRQLSDRSTCSRDEARAAIASIREAMNHRPPTMTEEF